MTHTGGFDVADGKIISDSFFIFDLTVVDSCIYGMISIEYESNGEIMINDPVYMVIPNVTTPTEIPADILRRNETAVSDGGELFFIFTAEKVSIPKDDKFDPLVFRDISENEIALPGDPDKWFENAAFISLDTPNPDGSIKGVSIDFETEKVLMAEGGDKVNLTFLVEGMEYQFGFGPGTQIAARETDTGYLLLPEETVALSPPQLEPIQ
jgi:hypothetical protein